MKFRTLGKRDNPHGFRCHICDSSALRYAHVGSSSEIRFASVHFSLSASCGEPGHHWTVVLPRLSSNRLELAKRLRLQSGFGSKGMDTTTVGNAIATVEAELDAR